MCLKRLMLMCLLVLLFGIGNSVGADDGFGKNTSKPVADISWSSSGINWLPKIAYKQITLTVSKPDGTFYRKTFDSGSSPYVDLASLAGYNLVDGHYTYELTAMPYGVSPVRSEKENETANRNSRRYVQSGSFLVKGGMIIQPGMPEPQINKPYTSTSGSGQQLSLPSQTISEDTYIQGSLCVGVDCTGSETWGEDNIRIKESNLRIHFEDTSSTSSYPTNDWRLLINDLNDGGEDYFAIEDSTENSKPLMIKAGAPSNGLFMSAIGNIGFKTAVPEVELHAKDGDAPALRLEQDTTSGLSAQAWDMVGTEQNFFIRDVTNANKQPLQIQPGTPTSTLCLKSSGRVGIGTSTPGYTLDVSTTGTGANIVASRTDGASFQVSAAGAYGYTGTRSNHPLRLTVNSIWKMQINGSGHYIDMADGGYYNGTWTNASSRKLKENIHSLSSEEAFATLNELDAVKFNYKTDKEEQLVGFIAEDVPELVATKNRTSLSPMDIVAVLTKVVQEQQKTIEELKSKIDKMENK